MNDADRLVDKCRDDVDRLRKAWAKMVTDDIEGAHEFRTDFKRKVFEAILALHDALE